MAAEQSPSFILHAETFRMYYTVTVGVPANELR